jgi:hypothetical protein
MRAEVSHPWRKKQRRVKDGAPAIAVRGFLHLAQEHEHAKDGAPGLFAESRSEMQPQIGRLRRAQSSRPAPLKMTSCMGNLRPEGNGELAGARTQDPRLKRALLYQLSYELVQGR